MTHKCLIISGPLERLPDKVSQAPKSFDKLIGGELENTIPRAHTASWGADT